MKIFCVCVVFCLTVQGVQAQVKSTIDSLVATLASTRQPDVREGIYNALVSEWAEANFDSAYRYAKLMQQSARLRGNKSAEIKSSLALGVTHDYHNHIDSARFYYQLARAQSEEARDDENLARADFNLAALEYAAGNYLSAIDGYRRTEQVFRKLNNERALSRIYNNLGQVFLRSEQFQSAIGYFQQSITLKEKLNDPKGKLNSLTNLAIAYLKSEKYDTALRVSKQTIMLAKQLGDSLAYKDELVNLGGVYLKLHKTDSAFIVFNEARLLVRENDPLSFTTNLWIGLAEAHIIQKNFTQAKAYLAKAEKAYTINPVYKTDYLRLQAQYFAALKQFDQAYYFQSQLMDETHKQAGEAVLKKLKEYEVLFETEHKERQIANLQLAKLESERVAQQRAFQRNVLVGLTVVLLGIAGVIFMQFKQKKEINARLTIALNEREVLLKEIHHRVKNNLQVISSLLNIQSKSVTDKSAQEAVREGRNRVKSMSMIHEQLYQKDNLTGIAMPQYVAELSESLLRSYGKDFEQVALNLNIDPVTLDVDTAIPLGLILNELITNSLKYAFTDNNPGAIAVTLKQEPQHLTLCVADNGVGMQGQTQGTGFGTDLVNLLATKLKATVSVQTDTGTTTELVINKYRLV